MRHLNVYGTVAHVVWSRGRFVNEPRPTGLDQNQNGACTTQFYSESWCTPYGRQYK